MRINKLFGNKGICSRRQTNKLIEQGRVMVNGQLAICGQWVEEEDEILLDGRTLIKKEGIYILLNKPVGITCTADEETEGNIISYMNYLDFIFPVGRLDKDSQGLILMTNDGELAHRILYAEHEHEKEYLVTVHEPFTQEFLESMAKGVKLGEVETKPCRLEKVSEDTFKIILTQGLNRQIRKMCLVFGYKVKRLERIRILSIEKGDLAYGAWRNLTEEEVRSLNRVH